MNNEMQSFNSLGRHSIANEPLTSSPRNIKYYMELILKNHLIEISGI